MFAANDLDSLLENVQVKVNKFLKNVCKFFSNETEANVNILCDQNATFDDKLKVFQSLKESVKHIENSFDGSDSIWKDVFFTKYEASEQTNTKTGIIGKVTFCVKIDDEIIEIGSSDVNKSNYFLASFYFNKKDRFDFRPRTNNARDSAAIPPTAISEKAIAEINKIKEEMKDKPLDELVDLLNRKVLVYNSDNDMKNVEKDRIDIFVWCTSIKQMLDVVKSAVDAIKGNIENKSPEQRRQILDNESTKFKNYIAGGRYPADSGLNAEVCKNVVLEIDKLLKAQ